MFLRLRHRELAMSQMIAKSRVMKYHEQHQLGKVIGIHFDRMITEIGFYALA